MCLWGYPGSCFLSAIDKRATVFFGSFPLSDVFGGGVVEGMDLELVRFGFKCLFHHFWLLNLG